MHGSRRFVRKLVEDRRAVSLYLNLDPVAYDPKHAFMRLGIVAKNCNTQRTGPRKGNRV